MSKLLFYIFILCLISLLIAAFYFGRTIAFSAQWPLYEALRTTASIIFAVVGAWLAIIYPDRLRFAFGLPSKNHNDKNCKKSNDNKAMNMGKLLSPAVNSTYILGIVLMIGVLAPMIKQLDFLLPYKESLRGLSYVLLVGLTVWQLTTIILTLAPADALKKKSDKEIRNKTYKDGLTRNMQTYKKDD